jgi:hypothetical protein
MKEMFQSEGQKLDHALAAYFSLLHSGRAYTEYPHSKWTTPCSKANISHYRQED